MKDVKATRTITKGVWGFKLQKEFKDKFKVSFLHFQLHL